MREADQPLELFFSYSHHDEELRDELETHLSLLKQEGLVRTWHDRGIEAGKEWEREIDHHLERADIILLLISPPFVESPYCWSVEMREALERHQRGEVRVIPIILRPVEWKSSPIGSLQALPKDGRPIVEWPLRDRAFLEIATELRRAIMSMTTARRPSAQTSGEPKRAAATRRFKAGEVSDRCVQKVTIPLSEPTSAMVWSPDGQRIALGSSVETTVLDLRNDARRIWQSSRNTAWLHWSPDGAFLAIADDELFSVVEGANGRTVWSTPGSRIDATVDWSPDGRCLACSNDETVTIHDASNGRVICQLPAWPRGALWSPDGSCLATGQFEQVQLWFVAGPQAPDLRALSIMHAQPLVWSPDSSRLALIGEESDVVHIWDVHSDRLKLKLKLKSMIITCLCHANGAVWSPNGSWIALASMSDVQIFDAADGSDVLDLSTGSMEAVDVSPDGLRLATLSSPGSATNPAILQLWDVSDLP